LYLLNFHYFQPGDTFMAKMKRFMRKSFLILLIVILSANNGKLFGQKDSVWILSNCIDYAFTRNIQIRKSEISNQRSGLYSEQAKARRITFLSVTLS
jgi:hypothetical protein